MPASFDDEEFYPEDERPARPSRPAKAAGRPAKKLSNESRLRHGWGAGQQIMERKVSSEYAQALKLMDQEQIIKFIDDEPYANYYRHWVRRTSAAGAPVNRPYVCLQSVDQECPLCDSAGDRPQPVSAFNVALISDDGVPTLRTWDVGPRAFNVVRKFATNASVGPLSKGYFAVYKVGEKTSTQTLLTPIRSGELESTYGIVEPTAEEIQAVGRYDADIVQIPKLEELEEIAAEMADVY
jgi:hypothetical protein